MLTQLKAYRWLIISSVFFLLLISVVTLYYKLDASKTANEGLTTRLEQVEANYTQFQTDVKNAKEGLEELRATVSTIQSDTSALQKRLGNTTKPTPNATNAPIIEKEANDLSKSVFERFK